MQDNNRDTPLAPLADEPEETSSGDGWMIWLIMFGFFLLLKMA